LTCQLAAGGGHLEALMYARKHGCPWDMGTCHAPLEKGTWRCCSGRGRTTARGTGIRVARPLQAGT